MRGVVLGSAIPGMFSAGLDLNEILREAYERTWRWSKVHQNLREARGPVTRESAVSRTRDRR